VSREEFRQWLEERLDLDLNEDDWPRGLERAIHELRAERDRLKEGLSRHKDELFSPRDYGGLSTEAERLREAMRPSRESSRLKNELNHEYMLRKVDVVAFSKHLYAIGETDGYLSFSKTRDEELEEARRQTLGVSEEAYQPGKFASVEAA
jgi:hypothetical protein